MNDRLIQDAHASKTEEMSNHWKEFFKEHYKKKSVSRSLKSMAKMEKYKHLAYPNYTVPTGPLSASLNGHGTNFVPPMGIPYSPFSPMSGVPLNKPH